MKSTWQAQRRTQRPSHAARAISALWKKGYCTAAASRTKKTCFYHGRGYKRIDGGGENEGTHVGLEDENEYLIHEVDDPDRDYREIYAGKFLRTHRKA